MTELPQGWAWTSLGDCCLVTLGQSPPGSSYNESGAGMPFFQGKAEFGELRPTIRKWTTQPTKTAAEDDVLISVRAPVGPTNLAPCDCAIGRGLASLRPHGGISSRYVLYWLRASQRELASRGTGTTFSAISGAVLREHPIPLAPLVEQRRIVAAIEEHFSRLDAAEGLLAQAKRRLVALRTATLAASTAGHERVALGELITDLRYGTSIKCSYEADGPPVLRIPNVQRGVVDVSDLKFATDAEVDLAPYALERGDLLFVRTNGSRDLIGRVASVDGAEGMAFASYLIRARPDPSRLDSRFAVLALSAPASRALIESKAATTAGQYNLNLAALRSLPVPLPPIEKQHSIVIDLEQQLSIIDAMAAEIPRALQRSAALRRSILEQAFSGKLAPQDPSDEPASVLLERIQAERAAAEPAAGRRPRRRATMTAS
jgi:type I restriction enzyme S subunit